MIINIRQKEKEMFEAKFEIVSNDKILGSINAKGKLGSMEVFLNGIYNNISFELKCDGSSLYKTKNNKFRPYQVIVSGNNVGKVYQKDKKTGIFSKYSYNELNYNGKVYKEYGIGLGRESKNPIYLDEKQIAQIDEDTIIYNDLYNYKIYIKNDNYSLLSIIFVCYMYINAGFKSGLKTKKSVVKYYNKTTNKELNSKYNHYWINEIKENHFYEKES